MEPPGLEEFWPFSLVLYIQENESKRIKYMNKNDVINIILILKFESMNQC